jgi:hypothetical protein
MDVIKGSVVKLTYTVTDLDTGQLSDPPDTEVAYNDAAGNSQTMKYSDNAIDRVSQGKYRAMIDTSDMHVGGCFYEIITAGPNAVRAQGKFYVIAQAGSS